MSMTVNLYTTNSNPKSLTKDLTMIGQARVISPTAQVSVLSPVLVIAHSDTLLPCNYVYIPKFGRYYFCMVSTDIAGRIILTCKVDYLMSWADYIKDCSANIIRAEQAGVNYVVDRQLPIDNSRFFIEGKMFDLTPLQYTEDMPYKYLLITN